MLKPATWLGALPFALAVKTDRTSQVASFAPYRGSYFPVGDGNIERSWSTGRDRPCRWVEGQCPGRQSRCGIWKSAGRWSVCRVENRNIPGIAALVCQIDVERDLVAEVIVGDKGSFCRWRGSGGVGGRQVCRSHSGSCRRHIDIELARCCGGRLQRYAVQVYRNQPRKTVCDTTRARRISQQLVPGGVHQIAGAILHEGACAR